MLYSITYLAGARGSIAAGSGEHLLRVITGTTLRSGAIALQKIVFRLARGNAVFHSIPIDEPLLDRSDARDMRWDSSYSIASRSIV